MSNVSAPVAYPVKGDPMLRRHVRDGDTFEENSDGVMEIVPAVKPGTPEPDPFANQK